MRKTIMSIAAYTLVAFLLVNCSSSPTGEEANNPGGTSETAEVEKKELSADEKAVNTFKNTMVVFTGNMALAFSKSFGDVAKAFTFDSETGKANIDSVLSTMPAELESKIDTMLIEMDKAFASVKEENQLVYDKMFKHAVMQEGIDITTKYELPEGFRPLSENLSKDDLMKYITYTSIASKKEDLFDAEDPVLKTYAEIFEWMQRAGTEFESDEEVKTFVTSLR